MNFRDTVWGAGHPEEGVGHAALRLGQIIDIGIDEPALGKSRITDDLVYGAKLFDRRMDEAGRNIGIGKIAQFGHQFGPRIARGLRHRIEPCLILPGVDQQLCPRARDTVANGGANAAGRTGNQDHAFACCQNASLGGV